MKKQPLQLAPNTDWKHSNGSKQTQHQSADCRVPGCSRCALKKPFELPSEIVHACHTGQLVIFAGAGVSTESLGVYPTTFYHKVKDDLGITDKKISFSELMTRYCSSPRSRKDLLLAIKERIDYVRSFPELYERATEFHRELSTIPYIDEILTTNWDDFFERECDATPVVTGQDFAVFQDIPGRKVFKLHGSIYNYGSIVATDEDYHKCYKQLSTGVIGAKLKLLLLSKTIIFVGFSFDDGDFQKIYRLLSKEVKGIIPRSFVITLDEKAQQKLDSLGINATPIITSAAFFVKTLKEQLIKDNLMLPDRNFGGLSTMYDKLMLEHYRLSKLSLRDHPNAIYSLVYQDGLQHAFEHMMSTKHSGGHSDLGRAIRTLESYDVLIKHALHGGNYLDVAYFTGYQVGLLYLLLDKKERKSLPLYYLFGCGDILNYDDFIKLEKDAVKRHKAANKIASLMASRLKYDDNVFHRTPFL